MDQCTVEEFRQLSVKIQKGINEKYKIENNATGAEGQCKEPSLPSTACQTRYCTQALPVG